MATKKNPAKEQASNEKQVPWDPFTGVIFIIIVFFLSQYIAGNIVSFYAALRHMGVAAANDWLSNSVAAQFVFILLAESLAVGLVYLFMKKKYQLNLSAIGLKKPKLSDPAWGLLGVVPYYALLIAAIFIVKMFVPGFDTGQHQDIGFDSVIGNGQLILTFISLVILPPIAEEIMVRGFLYSSLKKAMPVMYAAFFTSLIFGAAHLMEGDGSLLWVGFVDTFVLSLVLVYLREKTGSLWASITLHMIKNGLAYVQLFVLHTH